MEQDPRKAPETGNSDELLELPELFDDDFEGNEEPPLLLEDAEQVRVVSEEEYVADEIIQGTNISVVPENRPRKVYSGMWGQREILAVGFGLASVLTVILLFLIFVVPAKRELERNRVESAALEQELMSSRQKYGSITDTQTEVASLLASVDDFEINYLRIPATGQTELYQQLNVLIGQFGLVNTNGPDYAPLDIADTARDQQQLENERGRDKLKSLFPGLYVTLTVEGSYGNLRRFIREIETSRQFIMISSIEFVPADEGGGGNKEQNIAQPSGQNPGANPLNQTSSADRGKTFGETVSLKLEMAAYFSRPGRGFAGDQATGE